MPGISLIKTGYIAFFQQKLNVDYNLIFKYCDDPSGRLG
jgi:hypothetical protein